MIPGYNHNVKYKDRIFHVQTEDSGVENPHIITHVFVGGNIIESRKTSYADIVKSDRLNEMLVELMQDQHKAMLRDLIVGRYDARIAERSVNAATLNGPAPLNVDAGAQHRASLFAPSVDVAAKPGVRAPAAGGPAAPRPITAPTTPPSGARPARPVAPTLKAPPPAAPTMRAPPPPANSFFGPPPPAPSAGERFIEAETLQRAFDSKNESAVDSIFGEDLISEKSLDEVILSYLAEDMQKE
jgi:hypothetical protein